MYASKRSVVLSLAPLLCALSAFPQAAVVSLDHANQFGDVTMTSEKQIFAMPNFPKPGEESKIQPLDEKLRSSKPADFNRDIYYRNKLEFSLDVGWLPINIPFPLDVFVGDVYNTYPLKYTLLPIFASLRWHMGGPWGPKVLRGNFDFTFTGSITGVARGPESRYFAYLMG